MKRVLKTLLILTAALMLCLLYACSSEPAVTTAVVTDAVSTTSAATAPPAVTTSAITTTAATTQAPVTAAPVLTINGTDLSEFSIIYGSSSINKKIQTVYKQYLADDFIDFDKASAERLRDYIKERYGIELTLVEETEAPATKMIAVKTMNVGSSILDTYDYRVMVKDDIVRINGGIYGTTWHALDYLEEYLNNAGSSVNLTNEFTLNGTHDLITVGCVGDSITQGVGTSDQSLMSYPSVMQRVMWKDYVVINYGNSGKTMRSDLVDSYQNTSTYTKCLNNCKNIDIMLIMLGTNDSNRVIGSGSTSLWGTADNKQYMTDAKSIIATFYRLNKNMSVFIMNCPKSWRDTNFGAKCVRDLQSQLYEELKADGKNINFFDMYSFTSSMHKYFPDNLHPNEFGSRLMGTKLAEVLTEYVATQNTK